MLCALSNERIVCLTDSVWFWTSPAGGVGQRLVHLTQSDSQSGNSPEMTEYHHPFFFVLLHLSVCVKKKKELYLWVSLLWCHKGKRSSRRTQSAPCVRQLPNSQKIKIVWEHPSPIRLQSALVRIGCVYKVRPIEVTVCIQMLMDWFLWRVSLLWFLWRCCQCNVSLLDPRKMPPDCSMFDRLECRLFVGFSVSWF